MTVSVQTPVNSYTSAGTSTFVYSFQALSSSHVLVTVNGVTKTLGSDYSVTGVGVLAGGTITGLTTIAGDVVVISRSIPLQRLTDYQSNGDLLASTLNPDFDLLWQALQGLNEKSARALTLSIGSTASAALPTPAASQLLGWNSAANAIQNYVGASSSPVSAAMAPVVAAVDLASGRTALGLGSTDAPTFAGLNGGQIAGLRNKIINGGMQVAQRGTASATQGYSTVDRFYCNRAGAVAGLTMSQVFSPFSSNKYSLSMQRDSGNALTASMNVYQAIEGVNCRDMAGKTVTASFLIGTGASVTTSGHLVSLVYQTTTTDIGPASGGWNASIPSASFTVTAATAFTQKTTSFAVPANATQVMLLISLATSGTAGVDERFYITEVQLEQGSVATPFEQRPYGLELALCQRYLPAYVATSATESGLAMGQAQSGAAGYVQYQFQVPSRVPPTGCTVSSGTTHFKILPASGASIATTSISFSDATTQAGRLTFGVAAGLVAGNATNMTSASASAQLLFTGCEL